MTLTVAQQHPQIASPGAAGLRKDPWLALVLLAVFGCVSGITYYLGFVRPYRLDQYYRQPLLDLAKISGSTASAANAWALTWAVLFACYFLAFKFAPSGDGVSKTFRRVTLGIICGWAAIFCITLIFMYPVGAADLFDQIFRARLTAHYALNPFTTLPSRFPGDPFQAYVAWRGDPSPYGPMWELPAAAASWLSGDNLWTNLVLFKLLVVLAYAAGIALTYGILRTYRPEWAFRGTLFFAWNPLMLFEVPGNGHNDAVVGAFMLLVVFLFVRAKRAAVLPAAMAGALAKFIPLLFVPVFAVAIWRDRMRPGGSVEVDPGGQSVPVRRTALRTADALITLAIGVALSIALAVALYAPFWQGPDTIGALGRQRLFTASIPKVALDVLTYNAGMAALPAEDLVRNAALALVIVVTLAWSVRIFLSDNVRTAAERRVLVNLALTACYEITFIYLAFATLWFQPWYIIWLIALTAPVARFTNVNRTFLFCIGGVANYFVWDFIWLWNKTDMRNNQITAALAVYTLPIAYSLYVWLKPVARRWLGIDTETPSVDATGLEGATTPS